MSQRNWPASMMTFVMTLPRLVHVLCYPSSQTKLVLAVEKKQTNAASTDHRTNEHQPLVVTMTMCMALNLFLKELTGDCFA